MTCGGLKYTLNFIDLGTDEEVVEEKLKDHYRELSR